MTFAAFKRRAGGEIVECKAQLEIEEARELAGKKLTSVRAFIGYSGWSKQQLEAEMAQKAWIVRKADQESMDMANCKELWPTIMRGLGPWYRLLASAPDDPSRN